jgi:transposase, IS6 family
MGFFSLETAGRTLQGYEGMHMIRKGQMQGVAKGDIGGQVTFIARLFNILASHFLIHTSYSLLSC